MQKIELKSELKAFLAQAKVHDRDVARERAKKAAKARARVESGKPPRVVTRSYSKKQFDKLAIVRYYNAEELALKAKLVVRERREVPEIICR